jgi:ATP-dependent Clp protease adaptor protein ClpS
MASTDVVIDDKIKLDLQEPKLWKVVLLNDDKTPMEFVIDVLTNVFKHGEDSARSITLEVHETGAGIAGVYSFEIAEHRGVEATNLARENGFPLQIRLEEE